MRIASRLVEHGAGLARVLIRRSEWVELDWDDRQKSRLEAVTSHGESLAIILERGRVMRGGDVLLDAQGRLVLVKAKAQPVMLVRPCSVHGAPHDLSRAAYHLGNRHVPVDVRVDHLRFEPDHVLAQMLRGLHFNVEDAVLDFEPEAGAYHRHADGHLHAGGGGHVHHGHGADESGHGQGDDHEHDHGHDHTHVNHAR